MAVLGTIPHNSKIMMVPTTFDCYSIRTVYSSAMHHSIHSRPRQSPCLVLLGAFGDLVVLCRPFEGLGALRCLDDVGARLGCCSWVGCFF